MDGQPDLQSEKVEPATDRQNCGSRSHQAENISTTTSLSDSPAVEHYELSTEPTQTLVVRSEAIAWVTDPVAYFGQFGQVELYCLE